MQALLLQSLSFLPREKQYVLARHKPRREYFLNTHVFWRVSLIACCSSFSRLLRDDSSKTNAVFPLEPSEVTIPVYISGFLASLLSRPLPIPVQSCLCLEKSVTFVHQH